MASIMEPSSSEAPRVSGQGMYTCVTCHVAFQEPGQQRDHYKTDWHRYNLKRKVAGMPPVDRNDFNNRVIAQQAKEQQEAEEAKYSGYCGVCRKAYSTANAYNNHLQSNRHRELTAAAATAADRDHKSLSGMPGTGFAAENASAGGENEDHDVEAGPLSPSRHKTKDARGFTSAPAASAALVDELPHSTLGESTGVRMTRPNGATGEPIASPVIPDGVVDRLAAQLSGMATTAEPGRQLTEEEELAFIDEKIRNARFLKPSECLFCCKDSGTLERNVQHMTREHSFFIPDAEYLVDLPGLIQYLGEKVSVGNICLHCNGRGRSFHSLEAVQKHMEHLTPLDVYQMDKGHCKIFYEGDADLEYSDFYDFRTSYPDDDGGEELRESDERPGALVTEDEMELVLPNGVRLGHRALNRYYKQKFRMPEQRESVLVSKLMTEYRALGWTGTAAAAPSRDLKSYQRRMAHWNMRVGIKANKLQQYFRQQVIF